MIPFRNVLIEMKKNIFLVIFAQKSPKMANNDHFVQENSPKMRLKVENSSHISFTNILDNTFLNFECLGIAGYLEPIADIWGRQKKCAKSQ